MASVLSRLVGLADIDHLRSGYMRALALLLIVIGLYRWGQIIGVFALPEQVPFGELPGSWQAAIINLSVAFPVAAVGLWMLARWGVVLWFYAAGSQIAMHTLFAGMFGFRIVPIVIHVALLAGYAALVWLARRNEAEHQQAERAARQSAPEPRPEIAGGLAAGARARLTAALTRRSRINGPDATDQPATDNAA